MLFSSKFWVHRVTPVLGHKTLLLESSPNNLTTSILPKLSFLFFFSYLIVVFNSIITFDHHYQLAAVVQYPLHASESTRKPPLLNCIQESNTSNVYVFPCRHCLIAAALGGFAAKGSLLLNFHWLWGFSPFIV